MSRYVARVGARWLRIRGNRDIKRDLQKTWERRYSSVLNESLFAPNTSLAGKGYVVSKVA